MPILHDTSALDNVMQRCKNSGYMTRDFDQTYEKLMDDQNRNDQNYPNASWSHNNTPVMNGDPFVGMLDNQGQNPRSENQTIPTESFSTQWGGGTASGWDILAEAVTLSNIAPKEEDAAKILKKSKPQYEQTNNIVLQIGDTEVKCEFEVDKDTKEEDFSGLENNELSTTVAPSIVSSDFEGIPDQNETVICQVVKVMKPPSINAQPKEIPQKSSSTLQYATKAPSTSDEVLEKFDAKFVTPNQHVYTVEHDGKTIYTVKKGQPAQIDLSNNLLDDVYVCTGIFHSHPNYATNQISAIHITQNTFGAPFLCQNQNVWYRNIYIPSSAGLVPMTVALVKLQNEKALDVNFIMNSTDKESKFLNP